ncbi:MAG: DnaD domain protein [Oscillospiraceae bacterium]|nr:DnaD domain protein [Oscillospiraceae bacterium]
MSYRVVIKCGGGAFFVPNEAAENLKLCTAAQLRVLLLVMSRGFAEATPEIISAELGMSAEDSKDNLDYWVARGILECDGAAPAAITPSAASVPAAEVPAQKQPLPKPPETKLTMKEVQRLKEEDAGIAHVLSEAERLLGKTFTTSDTEAVVWLISYAGIPPEVLVTVIAYCAGIGKNNLRYIQKTAIEWLDSGIDTIEAAEERIRALNDARSWEGEVKRVLEIYGRNLVTKEKEFCESWRLYGISPELIHFAYEKCIEKTAKLSFPYINKILLSWHQKGIKTPAEAAAENKPGAETEKPSFDLEELERRMMLEDSVI